MAITRAKQSSLRTGVTKYDNLRAGLPFTPTIGTATDGGTGTTVSVAFTGNNTAGLTYTALSTPGSLSATSTTSPITVTGLTSGTAYTFAVKATNSAGDSPYSAASNSVTPATPSSYESIASVTGTGSSGTITFSSIPGTYQHLQIRLLMRRSTSATGSTSTRLRINSDSTAANYYSHYMIGNGSTVSAGALDGTTLSGNLYTTDVVNNSVASGIMSVGIIDIHDYASTTKNKTVRIFSGNDRNGSGVVELISGLYSSTSAITEISISTQANSFTTDSVFALYGIKA